MFTFIVFLLYCYYFVLSVISDTSTLEQYTGQRYTVSYCAHFPVLVDTVLSRFAYVLHVEMCRTYLVLCSLL